MLLWRAEHNEEMALQKYLLDPDAYPNEELRSLLSDGCYSDLWIQGPAYKHSKDIFEEIVGTEKVVVQKKGLFGIKRSVTEKRGIPAFSVGGIPKIRTRAGLRKLADAYVRARLETLMFEKFREVDRFGIFSPEFVEFIKKTKHNPVSKIWKCVVDSCSQEPELPAGSKKYQLDSDSPLLGKMREELFPATKDSAGDFSDAISYSYSCLRLLVRECSASEREAMLKIMEKLYALGPKEVKLREYIALVTGCFAEASEKEARQEMKKETRGLRKGLKAEGVEVPVSDSPRSRKPTGRSDDSSIAAAAASARRQKTGG